MKHIFKNIAVFLFVGFSLYFISSCQEDKSITYLTSSDLGILRTDASSRILGGDYSDWCMHSAADTFTYVTSFTMSAYINNTIAQLKWTTKQEYHCSRFDIERKRYNDYNYTKVKSVVAQGIVYDTTNYKINDTVYRVSDYTYRLKVIDIYGNYKYITYGQYAVTPPLNYAFGPAYPNPASGYFMIPFSLQWKDTVSIYIVNNSDTFFITKKNVMQAGTYKFTYNYDTTIFGHSQKRIYIKCNSLPYNDACKSYGDIEFN
jgi:hypothetical protein